MSSLRLITASLPPMSESLQQLILDYLDTHSSLSDTRTLSIPGSTAQATDADSQITILGALNSLLSREVSDQPSP
jgi:phenylalanyl-tRNA synthetase alpha chain